MKKGKKKPSATMPGVVAKGLVGAGEYGTILGGLIGLLESARRTAARHVNTVMTATYWEMGRRIVVHEQGGDSRAGYGEELVAT